MFTKVLGFLKTVFSSSGILLPILGACGVAVPPIAVAIIPVIAGLMAQAEDLFPESGKGALKKATVTNMIMDIASTMKTQSTGGQKETWDSVTPEIVVAVIDTLANVANNVSVSTGGDAIIDDSKWVAGRFGG